MHIRIWMEKHVAFNKYITWNALTTATLSPTKELTVEDLPTPPLPTTRTVSESTLRCRSLPRMVCNAVCVATGNCWIPVHSRASGMVVAIATTPDCAKTPPQTLADGLTPPKNEGRGTVTTEVSCSRFSPHQNLGMKILDKVRERERLLLWAWVLFGYFS